MFSPTYKTGPLLSFWKPLMFFEQSMVCVPLVMHRLTLDITEHYITVESHILLSNDLSTDYRGEKVLVQC